MMTSKRCIAVAVAALGVLALAGAAPAQESTEDLAKAVQNPVASLISVPFQSNTNFGIGEHERVQEVLNIQPVVPISIGEDWNLITRTILPVIYQPDAMSSSAGNFGLGDLNPTLFFSPAKPAKLIWGVGPAFSFPTATNEVLGNGQWCAGPSVVLLTQPGKWTIGALMNNLWSVEGDEDRRDVNLFLAQLFLNYNFDKGWYFTSSPILTADWEADGDDTWTVPLGGGVGRITKIGKRPINWQLAAYYNVAQPDDIPHPDWQLRAQLSLLYPKK